MFMTSLLPSPLPSPSLSLFIPRSFHGLNGKRYLFSCKLTNTYYSLICICVPMSIQLVRASTFTKRRQGNGGVCVCALVYWSACSSKDASSRGLMNWRLKRDAKESRPPPPLTNSSSFTEMEAQEGRQGIAVSFLIQNSLAE